MSNPYGQFTDQSPQQPPPRKGFSWKLALLISALLGGGMLLTCCGLGSFVYFVNIRETVEPLTDEDRDLVITAEDILQHAPDVQVDPSLGQLTKVSHLDRSRELTYEFQAAEGTGPLYINFNAGVEKSASDAQWAYGGLGIGLGVGFAREGDNLQQEERNDLWQYGDQSRCALLKNKNGKVGNLFMARKGQRYFMLILVGVYFEDAEAIAELLNPMLQQLETYDAR